MKSDKSIHIIRDHCWHAAEIGGGLWGLKGINVHMEMLMKRYFESNANHQSHSGEDQTFLTHSIYNNYKDDIVVYIGEQYSKHGQLLERGFHPEEPDIRRISKLLNIDMALLPENLEPVKGLSIIDAYTINEFNCGRCPRRLHIYIGSMFNNIPKSALEVIQYNIDKAHT